MTAPTARDRHAEHERTGQPCNCGLMMSDTDRARAVAVQLAALCEHDHGIPTVFAWSELIATALRAERAATWREAAELVERMIEPQAANLDTGNIWRIHMARRIADAVRARGEAGG